jgi:pre-mRNA-splicing factor CWC22
MFLENLIRGRGLFCRSIMKAQAASPPFTPVYCTMIAVINTKFPIIGELLLMRLLLQFRRAYKRSDKSVCLSSSKFIAHFVNQKIANEIVALQILTLLLEHPTDDSVEVAVAFMREVGAFLQEESSRASNAVFERFRAILHEGQIDKRTQYMVEVLFQVRKEKFKEHPSIPPDLDIVEEDDQITHMIGLTDELQTQDTLNVYAYDPNFLEEEQKYQDIKREILGDESDDEDEEEDSEEEPEEEREARKVLEIQDQTNTNLVNLRRAIYLTIMSSVNFEECAHKLMKIQIPQDSEIELANMIIECASQEKVYVNFYGLLAERFCRINEIWTRSFAKAFEETYKTIHRFETNRLRNIAKLFAHCLSSDALTWEVFALVRITEADTTSSSRIFCKVLFQELLEALGLGKLKTKLLDPSMLVSVETEGGIITRGIFDGLFPKDNAANTRFSINYFTSIGLGALTEDMREYLKNAPRMSAQDDSDESGSEDDSSESSSLSDSSEGSDRRQSRDQRIKSSHSEIRSKTNQGGDRYARKLSRSRSPIGRDSRPKERYNLSPRNGYSRSNSREGSSSRNERFKKSPDGYSRSPGRRERSDVQNDRSPNRYRYDSPHRRYEDNWRGDPRRASPGRNDDNRRSNDIPDRRLIRDSRDEQRKRARSTERGSHDKRNRY